MPDETRVFDVTRPSHVNPPATSKPVIVGHQPSTSDPMVKDEDFGTEKAELEPTRIRVNDFSQDPDPSIVASTPPSEIENPFSEQVSQTPAPTKAKANNPPAIFSGEEAEEQSNSMGISETPNLPPENEVTTPDAQAVPISPSDNLPPVSNAHIEGLHFSQPEHQRGWLKIFIPVLLAALIGVYLAIDSGLFGSGINLPFHVFKQKAETTSAPTTSQTPTNNQTKTTTSSVPEGFKEYKLEGTLLSFAAPKAWGDPSSVTESGYSQRGGDNKADGVYSYTLKFSDNKDIQIVVTSAKYLPPARTAFYYDYLQWCTGTNDEKIYQSVLHFVTENKVDTPGTISCDQGPMPNVKKLNDTTIVQSKLKSGGKALGDIYTKNLNDPEFVVFRVKDVSLTNGDDIEKLLITVKSTASATN